MDPVEEIEEVEEVAEVEAEVTPEPQPEPKEQPKESPEAKRARLQRELDRLNKKHPVETTPNEPSRKSNDLDYGQLAYLTAKGIESEEEIALAKDYVANTGRQLKEVVGSKYFQAELKEMREAKTTADATPSTAKRTGQSARDTVDYWIAKGELPEDRELRQKVVNERITRETKKDVFLP